MLDLGTLATGFSGLGWAGDPYPSSPTAHGDVTVFNAGINGNNTRNLLARLEKDCLSQRPDLVVMMVGTNDMNRGKHVPIDEYGTNLIQLANQIMSTGSKLLLLSILPFHEPYLLTRHPAAFFQPLGPQRHRIVYNEAIQKAANQTGSAFLDVGSLFQKIGNIGLDEDSLLRNEANSGRADGVHPTRIGYRFLALAVGLTIQCQQLPTGRIVCFGDSITRGDGSTNRASYPAYLQKILTHS